ncbi:hypothetical protein, partial [Escherichia coli]|uniref:hypothetical protein n=1 Tax=Escherichia coli TaxID=562 RepID=UPI001BC97530
LVGLGKAKYITVRPPGGQKKNREGEKGEWGTFCAEPKKTRKPHRKVFYPRRNTRFDGNNGEQGKKKRGNFRLHH